MSMSNEYLNHLAYEVQVALDCDADSAAKVVTAVLGLGQDPIKFANTVADWLQYHTDDGRVNVTALLTELDAIREKRGGTRYATCFPAGYQNRKQRRKERRGRC